MLFASLVIETARDSHTQNLIIEVYSVLENTIAVELKKFYPNASRIVQKPHPTENGAKKVANRPLLIPRMVFENGELWGAFEKERSD